MWSHFGYLVGIFGAETADFFFFCFFCFFSPHLKPHLFHLSQSSTPHHTMTDPVWAGDGATQDSPLTLDSFREQLIRQEETIIFALIERAQFPLNPQVYDKEVLPVQGTSLVEHMLHETEMVHAKVRRYTSPDECSFSSQAHSTAPILPALNYPQTIRPNNINVNPKLLSIYTKRILPQLTKKSAVESDERTFGSSAVADIACLQALSKRIHFGKFIAEAKFRAETDRYTALIRSNDADGIMSLLTNSAVEAQVCKRVALKASTYGADPVNPSPTTSKIDPEVISEMYQQLVMPVTKEVQVLYLLQRVSHGNVAVAGADERAALQHFDLGGDAGLVVQCAGHEEVFASVMANTAAYGFVPLEDSETGINKTTKLLLVKEATAALHIIAETWIADVRYIVLAKQTLSSSGADKVSLSFGLPHQSGSLVGALSVFSEYEISLSVIESLPSGSSADSYNFYVEFDGNLEDTNVVKALTALKDITKFLNVLGCYPRTV